MCAKYSSPKFFFSRQFDVRPDLRRVNLLILEWLVRRVKLKIVLICLNTAVCLFLENAVCSWCNEMFLECQQQIYKLGTKSSSLTQTVRENSWPVNKLVQICFRWIQVTIHNVLLIKTQQCKVSFLDKAWTKNIFVGWKVNQCCLLSFAEYHWNCALFNLYACLVVCHFEGLAIFIWVERAILGFALNTRHERRRNQVW